jgi:hypothetical protein
MAPKTLPNVTGVDVVGTRPKPADLQRINFLNDGAADAGAAVTYVVRIKLDDAELALTGQGFGLYVGDEPVEKYAGYPGGVYFKVYSPGYFEQHGGKEIKLSVDGETFHDTGQRLPGSPEVDALASPDDRDALPTQEEVLRG